MTIHPFEPLNQEHNYTFSITKFDQQTNDFFLLLFLVFFWIFEFAFFLLFLSFETNSVHTHLTAHKLLFTACATESRQTKQNKKKTE